MPQELPTLDVAAIPEPLRAYPHWVVWRPEVRNGKTTKRPLRAADKHLASVTDPADWAPLAAAARAAPVPGGVGFVFSRRSPFAGIDLDHCRDPATGQLEEWALDIVRRMATYTEVSPSGTGVHLLFYGRPITGQDGRRRNTFECYQAGRYFTVTGEVLPGYEVVEEREDEARLIIEEICGPQDDKTDSPVPANAEAPVPTPLSFDETLKLEQGARSLYVHGNWDETPWDFPSQSEADYYLIHALVRAGWREPPALLAAFAGSALWREDKWHHLAPAARKALADTPDVDAGLPWDDDAAPATAPLTLLTWDEAKALSSADMAWAVEGLVPAVGVTVLFGGPGVGKSFIAIDWTASLAHGYRVWLTRGLGPAGATVYVAAEGAEVFPGRLAAWEAENDLLFDPDAPWYLLPVPVPLDDSESIATLELAIVDRVGDTPVRMIVLDTLAQSLGDLDENSTKDMTTAVGAALRLVRDFDCAVVLIHHTGRVDTARTRGNRALDAAASAIVRAEEGTNDTAKLETLKLRGAPRPPSILTYKLEDGLIRLASDASTPPLGRADGDDETKRDTYRHRFLRAVAEEPGLSRARTLEAMGLKSNRVYEDVRDWLDATRYIERFGRSWAATAAGKAWLLESSPWEESEEDDDHTT